MSGLRWALLLRESNMANGLWAWHVHHHILVEPLNGVNGLPQRRQYIQSNKPYKERARRLRLLAVVKNQEIVENLLTTNVYSLPRDTRKVVRAAINRAIRAIHAEECKRCPWNGKTIFSKKSK